MKLSDYILALQVIQGKLGQEDPEVFCQTIPGKTTIFKHKHEPRVTRLVPDTSDSKDYRNETHMLGGETAVIL